MKKTFLGAIPVVYDQPTGGDVVTDYGTGAGSGTGLYDTSGSSTGSGSGVSPTNELPGGGPGMQTETGEPPKPFDEVPHHEDKEKTNYLPWVVGGIVLLMLFRRK